MRIKMRVSTARIGINVIGEEKLERKRFYKRPAGKAMQGVAENGRERSETESVRSNRKEFL